MAQRAHVPKFGNWENEDNVPYTVYFEKARKDRTGGKIINPNDPQENPDMFPNFAPQTPPSRTRNEHEESKGRGPVRPTHEPPLRREDGDFRRYTGSPLHNNNVGRRAANESTQQRYVGHGSNASRPTRRSTGSDHSIERSPLHPNHQAKIMGKGNGSPVWEGRNSHESSRSTPGRSHLKPATPGDESPNRGAAVPKFGEWDDNDPSSGENYTHIFDKVREERQTGPPKSSGSEPSYTNMQQRDANDNPKSCCLPWFRK